MSNRVTDLKSNFSSSAIFSLIFPTLIITFGQSFFGNFKKESVALFCYSSIIPQLVFCLQTAFTKPLIIMPDVQTYFIFSNFSNQTEVIENTVICFIASNLLIAISFLLMAITRQGYLIKKIPISFILAMQLKIGLSFLLSPLQLYSKTNEYSNFSIFCIATTITSVGLVIYYKYKSTTLTAVFMASIMILFNIFKYYRLFNFNFESLFEPHLDDFTSVLFNIFSIFPKSINFKLLSEKALYIFEYSIFEIINSTLSLFMMIQSTTSTVNIDKEFFNLAISSLSSCVLPVKINHTASMLLTLAGGDNKISIYLITILLIPILLLFHLIADHFPIFLKFFILQFVGAFFIINTSSTIIKADYAMKFLILIQAILLFHSSGVILALILSILIAILDNYSYGFKGEIEINKNQVMFKNSLNGFNSDEIFTQILTNDQLQSYDGLILNFDKSTNMDFSATQHLVKFLKAYEGSVLFEYVDAPIQVWDKLSKIDFK